MPEREAWSVGRERAIVRQNTATLSKATFTELLRTRAERVWGFRGAYSLIYAELHYHFFPLMSRLRLEVRR